MYYCVIMLMILIMMVMMAINLQICNCSPVQNHPLHMKQQRISFTFLFHSNTCQTSELVSSLINIPLPLRLEQNYQDDPRPALLSPCLAEAQAILRQMIREAEDPDKDLREELQGEEDEKHKKMKNKGRGRGRGGGKGKGRSRGGGKGRSRWRGAGGKKVVDQNDHDAVEEKDEPAPLLGRVMPLKHLGWRRRRMNLLPLLGRMMPVSWLVRVARGLNLVWSGNTHGH